MQLAISSREHRLIEKQLALKLSWWDFFFEVDDHELIIKRGVHHMFLCFLLSLSFWSLNRAWNCWQCIEMKVRLCLILPRQDQNCICDGKLGLLNLDGASRRRNWWSMGGRAFFFLLWTAFHHKLLAVNDIMQRTQDLALEGWGQRELSSKHIKLGRI